MSDPSIPSLSVKEVGVSVDITIPQTQTQVADQNNTYNQAGLTYSQTGVEYGGLYNNNQDEIPMELSSFRTLPIDIAIPQTQAQISDSGDVYNQAGFTYNQTGIKYGGLSNNNQDVVPMELSSFKVVPMDFSITDIYTPKPKPQSPPYPLAPGFFLFIPQ